MRIVVIGGSGHIGSYLIPRLIRAGHEVLNVSRSIRKPYFDSKEWKEVQYITLDREFEDQQGSFAKHIKNLHPDIVIDNICFTPESATALTKDLLGNTGHLLVVGSIWVHGYSKAIPTPENAKRYPIGKYGVNKNKIEELLLEKFHSDKFPVTILHPGHIVGKGWPCLNPQGNFNMNVFQTIIDNQPLILPNLGMETVHHVHADDIAQLMELSINNPKNSIGECFHVTSEKAISLRHYAEAVYSWFNYKPTLEFKSLSEMASYISPNDLFQTQEHISRSPCVSIEKARSRLGYHPKYTSLDACQDSLEWMIQNGKLRPSSPISVR